MFFGDASVASGWYGALTESQKIERAFMDGSHRFVLADKKIHTVSGIALDIPARRVYWIDHTLDFLMTISYDGHRRCVPCPFFMCFWLFNSPF